MATGIALPFGIYDPQAHRGSVFVGVSHETSAFAVTSISHWWSREGNLIRQISFVNPRWGAPCIHGELLKIGIEVSQATVAKYLVWHRNPRDAAHNRWQESSRVYADASARLRAASHPSSGSSVLNKGTQDNHPAYCV